MPFHCYGRGSSTHALPGGELHPSQSLRQGCGRDRKTHNIKAATFARSAGGKPEYQQVYSSALYGRDAVKDFDDYIRRDHRSAVKRGEDPLTRVAWPPQAGAEEFEEQPPEPHSYRQTQRQNNQQALNELDSWADAHDQGTQKWLQRWQKRQHDELASLELWDRLATPAAHNQQPKIAHRTGAQASAADSKARAEARAWAVAASASSAAAPAPAPTVTLSKPLDSGARAAISGVASAEAAANASALAASMPGRSLRAAVTSQRVALLDSLCVPRLPLPCLCAPSSGCGLHPNSASDSCCLPTAGTHSGDDIVPLNTLWLALKPLLLRSDLLAPEAILPAKQAVESRAADELVDTGEFLLELIALQEEDEAAADEESEAVP
jgi:hypothetical protein